VYPTAGATSSLLLSGADENARAETAMPVIDVEYFMGGIKTLRDKYVGDGVVIALLDTGVDADMLKIDLVYSGDFGGDDVIGHGTSVAGVIKNGESAGVAPEAGIMSLKVFDDDGATSSEAVADAIRYAVDNDAEIIAMPFSLMPVNSLINEALDYALEADVMLIAAAGNMGTEISPESLAAQKGVITVGSVDADGSVSSWSNYGSELDLFAPWDVVTLPGAEGEAGTSYSAAFIAGVSALILSEDPEMSVEDVLYRLKVLTYGPETVTKEDSYMGYGAFDLAREEKDKEKTAADEKHAPEGRIKGADVDEVVSKFMAQRKNKAEFTGQTIKMDIGVKGPGRDTLMPISLFNPITGDSTDEELIKQGFMGNVELLRNEYIRSE
ncbi:MAG: S8 family serine peptidase, partial [Candidatus Omnitrophica bacterium]|nr:S8 family serine peptidase [Candidatus Omnitrophota bacterium]